MCSSDLESHPARGPTPRVPARRRHPPPRRCRTPSLSPDLGRGPRGVLQPPPAVPAVGPEGHTPGGGAAPPRPPEQTRRSATPPAAGSPAAGPARTPSPRSPHTCSSQTDAHRQRFLLLKSTWISGARFFVSGG